MRVPCRVENQGAVVSEDDVSGRKFLKLVFWIWGVGGLLICGLNYFSLSGSVGVGTSTYMALGFLYWLGGIVLFGIGALAANVRPPAVTKSDTHVRAAPLLSQEALSVGELRDSRTRMCPYCAEFIKPEAIVCKHCGRDLKNIAPETALSPPPAAIPNNPNTPEGGEKTPEDRALSEWASRWRWDRSEAKSEDERK